MRTTTSTMARRAVTALAAGTLLAPAAALGMGGAVAHAAPKRAQLTYDCLAAPEGFEDQTATYGFVASLEMDLPDRVAPGDALPVNGTFSVQVPEELRKLTDDYFTTMQVISDDLTVPVSVNGNTTKVPVSRFDSGPMSPKQQPMIASGAVGADAFQVSGDASGEVRVGLPENDSAKSIVDGSPVAFNASALVSGGFVESFFDHYTYKLSCTVPEGGDTTVAAIGIDAPGGGSDAPGPAAAAGAPAAPTVGGTAAGAQSAPKQAPAAGNAPAKASSAPAASPKLAEAVGQQGGAEGAAQPTESADNLQPVAQTSSYAQARRGDVYVPGWLVATAAALLIVGAIALAVRAQLRVMKFREQLEG